MEVACSQLLKPKPGVNTGDVGSIPGSGRSPAAGQDNPLQYFCLGNPMDGGAWQTTVQVLGNTSYQVLIKSVKLLSYYQRTFSTCNIKRRKHTSPDLNLK